MKFQFKNKKLENLYQSGKGSYSPQIMRGFFKAIQAIKNAENEMDIHEQKRLHYHPLKGERKGEWAFNLTGKDRLIVTHKKDHAEKVFIIHDIEDYH